MADWRLSLNRSLKHLSAQLINTQSGEVAIGAIDYKVLDPNGKNTKVITATEFGKWFGEKIKVRKITKLVIDRGSCLYHGRIKAFVEGLRTTGIKI